MMTKKKPRLSQLNVPCDTLHGTFVPRGIGHPIILLWLALMSTMAIVNNIIITTQGYPITWTVVLEEGSHTYIQPR